MVAPAVVVRRDVRVGAGGAVDVSFSVEVPLSTPISAVGDAVLPLSVGIRTRVAVADGRDTGDVQKVMIQPLPAQRQVLDAFGVLGFEFVSADLPPEPSRDKRWWPVPAPPMLELCPPSPYNHTIAKVGLTFITDQTELRVRLTAFRHRRGYRQKVAAAGEFRLPHEDAAMTNWAAGIGSWVADVARSA